MHTQLIRTAGGPNALHFEDALDPMPRNDWCQVPVRTLGATGTAALLEPLRCVRRGGGVSRPRILDGDGA